MPHLIQPRLLRPLAQEVWQTRYFSGTADSVGLLLERVAHAVAAAEPLKLRKSMQRAFLDLLKSGKFLPNSPTLMNAGKKRGQLAACFVLPVEDRLEAIFETLRDSALIHQSGGGTGFSFSKLRAEGSVVVSTGGAASGPVSFMKIFDTATDTIKQGGTRRGANMAVLRVDHPDIERFIDAKRDFKTLTNFNLSVGVTDEFMDAVRLDRSVALMDPKTRAEIRRIPARQLWDRLSDAAWSCGDPGLVFLDRMNRFNPTPKEGEFESTNPCGEQPLLAYESCNLGSLNLGAYLKPGVSSVEFDERTFVRDVGLAARFLDNVITVNHYPVSESRRITLRNRKIGLGVMGLADALLGLGIPYDSPQARAFGERVMSLLDRYAKQTSMELAKSRGAFPGYKGSLWQRLGYPKLRNATVSTVAPTGTISLLAGCSSGIEPIFSASLVRNVLSGRRLIEVHPAVDQMLRDRGETRAAEALSRGELSDAALPALLGAGWSHAASVSIEGHLKMQAAFQRHSDSSVSKTINLPKSATRADVEHAYRLAYDLGCKGITVYRDQSRPAQVLESSTEVSAEGGDAGFCPTC